jgi:hypothetical protein
VLGRSELDLRSATLAPGDTLTLDIMALAGRGVVRVPHEWVVDMSGQPLAGDIVDERPVASRTTDTAAPHVRLTSVVAFGSLALRY